MATAAVTQLSAAAGSLGGRRRPSVGTESKTDPKLQAGHSRGVVTNWINETRSRSHNEGT